MSSAAQIEANRTNVQKSTGPRPPQAQPNPQPTAAAASSPPRQISSNPNKSPLRKRTHEPHQRPARPHRHLPFSNHPGIKELHRINVQKTIGRRPPTVPLNPQPTAAASQPGQIPASPKPAKPGPRTPAKRPLRKRTHEPHQRPARPHHPHLSFSHHPRMSRNNPNRASVSLANQATTKADQTNPNPDHPTIFIQLCLQFFTQLLYYLFRYPSSGRLKGCSSCPKPFEPFKAVLYR